MPDVKRLSVRVPPDLGGQRLDVVVARLFADYSRARLQLWIKNGQVTVDGRTCRPRDKLTGGETIDLRAETAQEVDWRAESIPLEIVYEDEALIVINKPAGLVVHPATGNRDGTLVNALLHYAPELSAIPRAGIVHRLDKDTSGLLVVARTLEAHHALVAQLQSRSVKREYEAVVCGVMTAGGTVDAPLGRHPVQRTRMAVVAGGKPAVTHYRVIERFRAHTHVRVNLETGRTHQIRVHMASIRHPLVGDPLYGGRLRLPAGASAELIETLRAFRRQALHAAGLELNHPVTASPMQWRAALPDDIQALLAALRLDNGVSRPL